MSAKWVRSKAWDQRHLSGPLSPVRWVLQAFSSIWLSVLLLIGVALYGILASVPIGIIALAPTWGLYAATLLGTVLVLGVLPAWVTSKIAAKQGMRRAGKFVLVLGVLLVLSAAAVLLWWMKFWPLLRFDPVANTGVRFFGAFADRYQAVQMRRLPYVEMSELEFYAWWPLKVILIAFVVNMVIATLRRIEFNMPRLGVLLVHTGIVTIAMGSVYYTSHKLEGDMLLRSGGVDESNRPQPGKSEAGFYDNTGVALWLTQNRERGWEQRRLSGVPRYNDYNLGVVPGVQMPDWGKGPFAHTDYGPLSIEVPQPGAEEGSTIDSDLRFRVVGYAAYAEIEKVWAPHMLPENGKSTPVQGSKTDGGGVASLREIEAVLDLTLPDGSPAPGNTWRFVPESPAERIGGLDLLGIEYTRGMPQQRWDDLSVPIPSGARHALVVEVPARGGKPAFKAVYPAEVGQEIRVGETGFAIKVVSIEPRPPMPLITAGYRGATSSVAVVHVSPPDGEGGFDRWLYHRFPEITQDMLEEKGPTGMPKRRDADSSIRISYIDASTIQVYFDELEDGSVRSIVRVPDGGISPQSGQPRITMNLRPGGGGGMGGAGQVQVAPKLALKLGARFDHVKKVDLPRVVPLSDRDKGRIGNHQAAAVAVEVSDKGGAKSVHWLAFTQYLGADDEAPKTIELGDGRRITLAFGRVWHAFEPPMAVSLLDFEMTPYPHSTTPRDYRSDVIVSSSWSGKTTHEERRTSLNEPLLVRTPFVAPQETPLIFKGVGWVMSLIAPNQYKFSQAGWDQGGWRESEALVTAGKAKRPSARFTILGVGNNPGIYIIAAGAVFMSIGIPYAFYLKPWLVQRQKRKLQAAVARGEIRPRGRSGHSSGVVREASVATHDGPGNGVDGPSAEKRSAGV